MHGMKTELLKSSGQVPISRDGNVLAESQVLEIVKEVLANTRFIDIHTHLFSPAFGKMGL